MKRIYHIILIVTSLFFCACQADENLAGGETGYLRLSVNEDKGTNTRAVPTDYDAEQIAVKIVDANDNIVEETEDADLWKEEAIELPVGTYTIKAASNGFDGKDAGFEIPYYTGSKEISITNGVELNETVTCTLANVKVSAVYMSDLVSKVKSIALRVYDEDEVYSLNFSQTDNKEAYFPVVDALYADITITNNAGESHTLKAQKLCNTEGTVQARDHYILYLRLQSSGSSDVTVTVNPTTHEYSYTFNLSTVPSENATLTAQAWDRLVYLKATDVVAGSGVSLAEGVQFQYRTTASGEAGAWTNVAATQEAEGVYTALVTGLTASTEYQYQLMNKEGVAIGEAKTFETGIKDNLAILPNGDFEGWCTHSATTVLGSKDVVFPYSEEDYNNGDVFWDTSNTGANSAGELNPTNSATDLVVSGTKAARLESKLVNAIIIKAFAAASLYAGSFGDASMDMTARVNFGRPFTSRPVALHGYYQYTPANVTQIGGNLPSDATVSSGSPDQCAIYIALSKKSYTINNGDASSFIDFENDDNIIAYGTIEGDYVTEKDAKNGYKEFTIPLQYKESQFGETPTHIIIVCSASKYGDYMTGGVGSTLYVDDFSLVYDGTPTIWKNK